MSRNNFSLANGVTSPITLSLGLASLIVFALFALLKLAGSIDWSWWMVASPLWIGGALCLLIVILTWFVLAAAEYHSK